MTKDKLPAEVHDEFRKANVLHGYVKEHLSKAAEYAPQIGAHLLAAKKATPHGRWEPECERLFDGSLRNAQFYMQIARDLEVLPKAQKSAILFLEGSLDGTAKAARKAARKAAIAAGGKKPPKRSNPTKEGVVDVEFEEADSTPGEDTDSERTPEEPSSRPPRKGKDKPADSSGKPGRESDSAAKLVDQITKQHIGHIARGLTKIAVVNGGEGAQFRAADAGLNQLIKALKKMREGAT